MGDGRVWCEAGAFENLGLQMRWPRCAVVVGHGSQGVGRKLRERESISVEELRDSRRREMGDRRWRETGDGRRWEMGDGGRRWGGGASEEAEMSVSGLAMLISSTNLPIVKRLADAKGARCLADANVLRRPACSRSGGGCCRGSRLQRGSGWASIRRWSRGLDVGRRQRVEETGRFDGEMMEEDSVQRNLDPFGCGGQRVVM